MIQIKKNFFVIITFLSIVSLCGADDKLEAINSLQKDFQTSILNLEDDKLVFNYRDFSVQQNKTFDQAILDMKNKANSFYFKSYSGGQMGNGLYAASNPFQSSNYGGDSWLLSIITIPAGTKVLDIHKESSDWKDGNRITLSKQTVSLLKQAFKCDILNETSHFTIAFLFSPQCLNAFKEFVKEFKISAVIYDWSKSAVDGCNETSAAMVIYDQDIFNEKNVKFLGDISTDDLQMKKIIKKSAFDNKNKVFEFGAPTDFMLRYLQSISISDTKDQEIYEKWREKMLFCN